jgi:hypothetical protein
MQLNDEQKTLVAQWVKESCGLSEIQRRLADQFKLNLLYMDVRFLLIELGLNLQEKKSSPPPPKDLATPPPVPAAHDDSGMPGLPGEPAPASGGVIVDVDRLMRPGSLVSGTVVFSDGVKATWMLDQAGRLALGGTDKSYRPSAQDVQEFQVSIARELQKRGYG